MSARLLPRYGPAPRAVRPPPPRATGAYAAGQEDVALPLRVLGEERYFVVFLLQWDFFVAVLQAVPDLRQLPGLPLLEGVVVRFFLEAQREDALGDQVLRGMRAKLFAITALMPRCKGARAACSRLDP